MGTFSQFSGTATETQVRDVRTLSGLPEAEKYASEKMVRYSTTDVHWSLKIFLVFTFLGGQSDSGTQGQPNKIVWNSMKHGHEVTVGSHGRCEWLALKNMLRHAAPSLKVQTHCSEVLKDITHEGDLGALSEPSTIATFGQHCGNFWRQLSPIGREFR